MTTLIPLLMYANAILGILLIILILLQRSDPAAGGMFGGTGGNQVVVRNPLARPTALLAGLFLLNCVLMAYLSQHGGQGHSVMEEAPAAAQAPNLDVAPLTSTTLVGAVLPTADVTGTPVVQ